MLKGERNASTRQLELVSLLTKVAHEADRACVKHNGLNRLRDALRLLHGYERRVGMRPDGMHDDDESERYEGAR